MNVPSQQQQQHQQHQHQQQHQQQQQQQQQQVNHGSAQSYGGLQGSSAGNLNSFAALPPNPYNINNHLMSLSMQTSSQSPSSGAGMNSSSLAPVPTGSGLMSGANSGSTTPLMAYTSAPSSPNLANLQYNPSGNVHYGQSSSSLYRQSPQPQQHQQHSSQYSYHSQQQHQHPNQNMSTSSLTASFYPASPSHQQQQQQSYQQPQQQQQQQQSAPNMSFSSMPPAPLRQQPQYAPLVPPLSEAHYAQYHQLLGSALSSAASTPYHSNQSTPYSSMPTSPTLEHLQLSDPNMVQKPKRRQVKNACVNCQKACKKCDEGRPCSRCIKYGLTETCVDSTRKVRKKGIKRGPYKRKVPPSQLGSASASTTPIMSHAVLAGPPTGYMSEPVTALNSPTQSHMLPFTSSAMGFGGYGGSSGSTSGYSFQTQGMDNSYVPPYTTSYSGASLYSAPYVINDGNVGNSSSNNPSNNTNLP